MDTSLTYGQLLALPKWQEKRLTIIKRDKLICQKCYNTSYQKDNFYGTYTHTPEDTKPYILFRSFDQKAEEIYTKDEKGTLLIPNSTQVMLYLIKHRASGTADIPRDGYMVAASRFLTNEELLYYFPYLNPKLTHQDKIRLLHEKYKDLNNKVELIPERNDLINVPLTELKWIFVKDLNVHHTYYQIDKLPWEYPDECLQTLCRSCHEKVHEEEIIPVRDATGIKIGNYKPCTRCHGAGWFPEYSYYENGICFKCRGEKYLSDEFIIKD